MRYALFLFCVCVCFCVWFCSVEAMAASSYRMQVEKGPPSAEEVEKAKVCSRTHNG